MNIKRIIREEIDDFAWIKDVGYNNTPKKGTAWVIMDVPDTIEDSFKVQEFLFNLGFTWPLGSTKVYNSRIASIGAVWDDNIEDNTFTYSSHSGVSYYSEETWWDTLIDQTEETELHVYRWYGDGTAFSHTLSK